MIGRGQQFAVTATCLVAAVTYAGAVTTRALLWFVLPGVAIAALVAWRMMARPAPWTALIAGALLVLGWSELVNIWSGTSNGPAARSTFAAAGCTLVAVIAASSRRPGLFLLPLTGVVFGALALGAAAEVGLVAVATAVCAAGTLGWIGQSQHKWAARPRQGVTLVVVSFVVGAAAAGAVVLQQRNDPRPPLVLARGQVDPTIKPAWTDPLAKIANTQPRPRSRHRQPISPHAKPQAQAAQTVPAHTATSAVHVWLIALAALGLLTLALLLAGMGRFIAVRFAWRRLRRRLTSGSAVAQISGAWIWARMRLEACRLPLSSEISPDVLLAGGGADALPPDVVAPLRRVAKAVTSTAFSRQRPINPAEVVVAWTEAARAERSARHFLTRRGRISLALRGPTRSHIDGSSTTEARSR